MDEYSSFWFSWQCRLAFWATDTGRSYVHLVSQRMYAFECFCIGDTRHFSLEHPVASVLGQAEFGDCLVVNQGVSVGGDVKLRYPRLGEGMVLFSKCSLIGEADIRSIYAIGARVKLNGESIPDNVTVSNRGTLGFICLVFVNVVRGSIFKS